MINKKTKNLARKRRHGRVRRKISGTPDCPRLNVFRSLKHIYVQVIDDVNKETLVAASTLDPELKNDIRAGGNTEAAVKVGELVAKRAKAANINKVVFDRGGYLYHGRVKALADAARKEGMEF